MPTRTTTASASFLTSSLALALLTGGCPGDDDPEIIFPADYAETYTQVRDCRRSIDHDSMHILVLASPEALASYQGRDMPFPVGSIIVKEEYADETCTDLVRWAAMRRADPASHPEHGGWDFQQVSLSRREIPQPAHDPDRCGNCHEDCGMPPDGYDFTCTAEP